MLPVSVAIALLLALAVWFWEHHHSPPSFSAEPGWLRQHQAEKSTDSEASNGKPLHVLASVLESLQASRDASTARQKLAELRQTFSAMPYGAASAGIRKFLDSRADALTHQGFKIGGKGFLEEAPSLRTFLLDYLGQIDPAAAASYAKVILSQKDSPDEWVLALRNLASGDATTTGRILLQQKAAEMLNYEPWQRNPSIGFLEAFDVAVYLGGDNLVPTLTELLRKQDNPAVAHAAFLALDRLAIYEPATLLAALEAAPELMQGRERTRANYFARADVRDSQQKQVLEQYLLDPKIGVPELDQFAGLFPNANYMISHNLLTPTQLPEHSFLVSRDAASLQVVQDWLVDPRFAKLRPQLQKAQRRLQDFTQQAAGR